MERVKDPEPGKDSRGHDWVRTGVCITMAPQYFCFQCNEIGVGNILGTIIMMNSRFDKFTCEEIIVLRVREA